MKNDYPKFENSDAAVFFDAAKKSGDLQIMRHFVASMKVWDKTLLKASEKGKEREQ